MALESFPPFTLVSARFLLSGALMLAGSLLAKARLPRGRELALTALNGVLILGIGNACLTYSELWIPSGLAALIVTTTPFWMVGLDALLPGGERLRAPVVTGILVGAAGAALLVAPGAFNQASAPGLLKGFLALQLGCLAWSYGSIRHLRLSTEAHPIVSGAVQQLAAGIACLLPAFLIPHQPIEWKFRSTAALLYLVVFGSIVGYSSHIYALEKLPVALVSIYTYINPVVAVMLGWLFYREPFGWNEALSMGIIFLGVTIIKRYTRPPAPELD